jgi:hypothetical protein
VATMYLKQGSTATPASASTCTIAAFAAGEQTITCSFTADVDINTFNTVALSIMPPA